MPVKVIVTGGTVADCSQALPLIEGIAAEHLLADKAYDTNEIIDTATERGMNPVIPPKSNRKEKREYDRALYKLRHLVENGFLDFKQGLFIFRVGLNRSRHSRESGNPYHSGLWQLSRGKTI